VEADTFSAMSMLIGSAGEMPACFSSMSSTPIGSAKRSSAGRRGKVAAYLPILALSTQATSPSYLLERGFDDVLRIPITMSEFKARILTFLRLREASEERFQTLFESTPIGIFRVAPNGRLLMANPALLKMLGFSSLDAGTRRVEQAAQPDAGPLGGKLCGRSRLA
jgi:PAS domain-containing protein